MLPFLRSSLFYLLLLLTTPLFCVVSLIVAPCRPHTRYRIITLWTRITGWMLWHVIGLRYQVLGQENIPKKPCVILSKHQSAWETLIYQIIFPPIVFVLKRELLLIPFFGWGLALLSMISIDRRAGKNALNQVLKIGQQRLIDQWCVLLFPEGTRVAPGQKRPYKMGGALLATQTGTLVLPVAHNAGEFWPRNSFIKYPGIITVSIGYPIAPQMLSAEVLNKQVETWIEAETQRISTVVESTHCKAQVKNV